jgi:hypothetical protein
MSWGAQSRSKDAKTPSASTTMSRNPKPALCGIQRQQIKGWFAIFFCIELGAERWWSLGVKIQGGSVLDSAARRSPVFPLERAVEWRLRRQ